VLLGAYTISERAVVEERVEVVRSLFPVVGERWSALAGLLSGGEQEQVDFAQLGELHLRGRPGDGGRG
jgi:branched-chain amino acid transport system ATP-binding protein